MGFCDCKCILTKMWESSKHPKCSLEKANLEDQLRRKKDEKDETIEIRDLGQNHCLALHFILND